MKNGLLVTLILSLSLLTPAYAEDEETNIRKAVFAGQFYSDGKIQLSGEVKKYLEPTPDLKLPGEPVALIVPHAGYVFSAPVAAYAYKAVKDSPRKTVILIGPSHNYRYDYISIFPKGFYETPLGRVRVNEELIQKFAAFSSRVSFHPSAHYAEHSLEVQLPFLQEIWGNEFTIVPILIGDTSWETIQTLKEIIIHNLPEEPYIIIASSDMSHYHNYEKALSMDRESLRLVTQFDSRGLYEKVTRGECEWCGVSAVIAVMEISRELGADKAKILKYANSGDTAPPWLRDKERVVGYSAVAFCKEGEIQTGEADKKEDPELLTKEEQDKLLEIARVSIRNTLEKKEIPDFSGEVEDKLKNLRGVFVTLNKKGGLRGCIGFPEAVLPLYQAVSEAAVAAALKDYRFPPVTLKELPDIEIEISVLSPLEKVDDIDKIKVGKHGLVIRKGLRSGLLLPQVPVEYGWDRNEFLKRICEKAGLPAGAWRENAELYVFSAQVFHEEEK